MFSFFFKITNPQRYKPRLFGSSPVEDPQSARTRPLTVPTAVLGAPRDPRRSRHLRSAPGGRRTRGVPDTSKVTFHGSDPVKDAWLRASEGEGEFQGVRGNQKPVLL